MSEETVPTPAPISVPNILYDTETVLIRFKIHVTGNDNPECSVYAPSIRHHKTYGITTEAVPAGTIEVGNYAVVTPIISYFLAKIGWDATLTMFGYSTEDIKLTPGEVNVTLFDLNQEYNKSLVTWMSVGIGPAMTISFKQNIMKSMSDYQFIGSLIGGLTPKNDIADLSCFIHNLGMMLGGVKRADDGKPSLSAVEVGEAHLTAMETMAETTNEHDAYLPLTQLPKLYTQLYHQWRTLSVKPVELVPNFAIVKECRKIFGQFLAKQGENYNGYKYISISPSTDKDGTPISVVQVHRRLPMLNNENRYESIAIGTKVTPIKMPKIQCKPGATPAQIKEVAQRAQRKIMMKNRSDDKLVTVIRNRISNFPGIVAERCRPDEKLGVIHLGDALFRNYVHEAIVKEAETTKHVTQEVSQ